MFNLRLYGYGIACFFITAPATAGPEWIENRDAGSLLATAQKTMGEGQLSSISGSLSLDLLGGDLEDMYLLRIIDPVKFTMDMDAEFDAQMFVFNVTLPGEAFGLLANDNTALGNQPFIGNSATDATGAAINLPGVYLIAVSGTGRNPVSLNGNIFNYGSSTEVSGPDGPGGINPHNGWTGDGPVGSYHISFTGAEFYDVPAPGAAALFAIAGMVGGQRRRSRINC
jgi:hypothetical protein